MVHHGHKTDGRALVLIKKIYSFKNIGARESIFLCLFSMGLFVCLFSVMPQKAIAQSDPVYASRHAGQTEIRLQQMETQVRDLTGKVEEQRYEINSLKQKIKSLEAMQEIQANQAPQQPQPAARIRDTDGGRMGASVMEDAPASNPLGLDLAAQDPKGMKTKTVFSGSNKATAQYEAAKGFLNEKKYDEAEEGFQNFLKEHGDHILASNAKYWLGETYYVRGNYKKAAREFAEGFQKFPDSAKSPDILLKLGLSLKGLDKDKDACVALGQLPIKFPTGRDDILERAKKERTNLSCDE